MSTAAKKIRLSRFRYRDTRVGLIVPLDHGLTMGPVDGLGKVAQIAEWIRHPALTGIVAHKGMIERLADRGLLGRLGIMVHLNGMSSLSATPDRKERLTSVETAARLGADAVSVQLNFDGTNDGHNLSQLGAIVDEAGKFGLPVLTMLYDKVAVPEREARLRRLRHLMRITWELGTDALKIAPPTALGEVPAILDGISEDVPVFFAGGSRSSDEELVALTETAIRHGSAGVCVGRNIFQSPSPGETLDKLRTALTARRHR